MGCACSSSSSTSVQEVLQKRKQPDEKQSGDALVDFEIGGTLGKGADAVVRVVTHRRSRQQYACKVLEVSRGGLSKGRQEAALLTQLENKRFFPRIHLYAEDNFFSYVVMELADGGNLFDMLTRCGPMRESRARVIFTRLVAALVELRKLHIVHRDIKPENILFIRRSANERPGQEESVDAKVRELDVLLADFGIATRTASADVSVTDPRGTWIYSAPEVLLHQQYDASVDLWSLGVCLYMILSASHPFDPFAEEKESAVLDRIRQVDNNDLRPKDLFPEDDEIWDSVSSEAKDMILKLLTRKSKRIQLEHVLHHPWLPLTSPSSGGGAPLTPTKRNKTLRFARSTYLMGTVNTNTNQSSSGPFDNIRQKSLRRLRERKVNTPQQLHEFIRRRSETNVHEVV